MDIFLWPFQTYFGRDSDKNEFHFFFLFSQASELLDHEWQVFVEPIFKVLEAKQMTPF